MRRIERFSGMAHKFLCGAVLPLLLALPVAFAQGDAAQDAQDEEPRQKSILARTGPWDEPRVRQGRHIFVVNLPLWRFLVSYYHEDQEEQRVAYAFLLGVADATERKAWCSPDDYTPATILDAVNEGLPQMKVSRYDERAAYVISEVLRKKYPCKKGEALPNSFAWDGSMKSARYDLFQKNTILTGEGLTNEWVIRQGEEIFAPNLSLSSFWVALNNRSSEDGNTAAYAFLLGVSDATEGKAWCSYEGTKSVTILEWFYYRLVMLDSSHNDERAAYVITEILKNNHNPCDKEH